jgi:Poxvirus A32 protein
MAPSGNAIHVYDGAAETIPCPHGEPFPDLPTSFILAAPTASGKTMIILNLMLRYYKGQFARIWMFSPSIKLDPQYAPLRKYLDKMSPDQDKEPLYFEDLHQQTLGKILEDQRKICEACRAKKIKIPQVCVILDDLADRGDILTKRQGGAQGSWLVTLATRGRHFGVTWVISSQVFNLVGTVLRRNVRCMCVWRLRNHKEVETLCEELSGVYNAKTLMQLYREATAEPFSFMFIRLDAKTRQTMFYLRFEHRLVPEDPGYIESDVESVEHGVRDDNPVHKPRQGARARHR